MSDAIDKARKRLEELWDSQGDCLSCGWHAMLSEHDVTDDDIQYALVHGGGILELSCISKDDDEPENHRGIKVNLNEE